MKVRVGDVWHAKRLRPRKVLGISMMGVNAPRYVVIYATGGDDARIKELEGKLEALSEDRERGTAALREAFGPELWALGHPAFVIVHLREEYAKLDRLWKEACIARDDALLRLDAALEANRAKGDGGHSRRCAQCDHWAVVDRCTICGAEEQTEGAGISVEAGLAKDLYAMREHNEFLAAEGIRLRSRLGRAVDLLRYLTESFDANVTREAAEFVRANTPRIDAESVRGILKDTVVETRSTEMWKLYRVGDYWQCATPVGPYNFQAFNEEDAQRVVDAQRQRFEPE